MSCCEHYHVRIGGAIGHYASKASGVTKAPVLRRALVSVFAHTRAFSWLRRARARLPDQARYVVVAIAIGLTVVTWGPMLLLWLGAACPSWQGFVQDVCVPLCHQDPGRSFHASGQVFPLCARCTGMWLGITLGVCAAMLWVKPSRWLVGIAVAIAATLASFAEFVAEAKTGQQAPITRAVLGFAMFMGITWAVSLDTLALLIAVVTGLARRIRNWITV